MQAIGDSVGRLRVPLISSALTTVLAFAPMAIAPGPPGDFIGSIAIAVIIMLLVSTILALVITPILAAWLLRHGPPVRLPLRILVALPALGWGLLNAALVLHRLLAA